ncbi:hypothetical protein CLU79DRAFT_719990 [Phycomyces nitens]|nr:hypothetical protein CLU79DRAFT_719990 [Phycomyces nitens]
MAGKHTMLVIAFWSLVPPVEPLPQPQPQSKPENHRKPKTVTSHSSAIGRITEDLEALYKESLDEYSLATEKIQQLEADIERYSSNVTKARDYEIRVEYLAQKLEQVSEERDNLEQELMMYRQRGGTSLDTPVSAVFDPLPNAFAQSSRSIASQEKTRLLDLQEAENEAFLTGILDAYEQHSTDDPDDYQQIVPATHNEQAAQEIARLTEQLLACDRGVQMTVEKYVTELEKERLETKALSEVVKKQEELIVRLENKLQGMPPVKELSSSAVSKELQDPIKRISQVSTGNEDLLREQVELQRIEIEDKQEMLTHLLTERNSLLRISNDPSRPSSVRSSIDVLAEFARPGLTMSGNNSSTSLLDSIRTSAYSQHPSRFSRSSQGIFTEPHMSRSMTPPPSGPPAMPPPPVPSQKASRRNSMESLHASTSTSSSSGSWSSNEYENTPNQAQHAPVYEEYKAVNYVQHTPTILSDPPMPLYDSPVDNYRHFEANQSKTSSMSSTSFLRLSNGPADILAKEPKKHSRFWKAWKQK